MSFISQESVSKLRRLMELRQRRDQLKVSLANASREYQELEQEVHLELAESPVDRLNNVDLGAPYGKVSFHAKETVWGKVVDEQQLKEYLRNQNNLTATTDPKLVKKRLNEMARAAEESNGLTPMPPGLTASKTRYVQITTEKGEVLDEDDE